MAYTLCLVACEATTCFDYLKEPTTLPAIMAPSIKSTDSTGPLPQPTVKSQFQSDVNIQTTEMHTGGMSVRIIESGFPIPQGENLKARVEDLRKNHDVFRKLIIHEPHGHKDMYGVLLVAPDIPEADIGVIFMDNGTYATMCGHATISVARYAVDRGLVRRPITSPETLVNIQAPCGLVKAYVQVAQGEVVKTGRTRFESVPAFVVATDIELEVEGYGKITVDVSYGGSFYAFVTAADLGLDLENSPSVDIVKAAKAVKAAAIANISISHPHSKAFFYGTMVVDSRTTKAADYSTNVCVFADGATDRSPCGSGTTARIALMHHRGLLAMNEAQVFKCGVTGSAFTGRPVRETEVGGLNAIVVQIEGQGRYIGKSTLTLESEDILGRGFLIN